MKPKFSMPHPAIVCSGPQLDSVIEELEAGTYPQPEDAIWRGDINPELRVRLAKATGASDADIAEQQRLDAQQERRPATRGVTGYPFDGYDGTDESFEKLQDQDPELGS